MTDRPRFIARGGGYTASTARAVDNLEALDAATLEETAAKARQKALDERMTHRTATADELRREQQWLESRLRYVGREIKRLGRSAR